MCTHCIMVEFYVCWNIKNNIYVFAVVYRLPNTKNTCVTQCLMYVYKAFK